MAALLSLVLSEQPTVRITLLQMLEVGGRNLVTEIKSFLAIFTF